MKKIVLSILSLLLIVGSTTAQDAKKAFKDAKGAFASYNLDPNGNKSKLKEAIDNVDIAIDGIASLEKEKLKAWQLKGEIYAAASSEMAQKKQMAGNPDLAGLMGNAAEAPEVDQPALQAYNAFNEALKLAEKKFEKKDALKGILDLQGQLYSEGFEYLNTGKNEWAFAELEALLNSHPLLIENEMKSQIKKVTKQEEEGMSEDDRKKYFNYYDIVYLAGFAAVNAKEKEAGEKYMGELIEIDYPEARIYSSMYQLYLEDDMDKAYGYLDAGRKKYPEDTKLLFDEINHYLVYLKEYDAIVDKIEQAVQADPENKTLYSTLGFIYDSLYIKEYAAGNTEKADSHFGNAQKHLKKAIELDKDFFDAHYTLGALMFHKAAFLIDEVNTLANDYSKEGKAKYDAKKVEMMDQLEMAFPHFKNAEMLNPNDINTLLAIREYYVRKEDYAMAKEMKGRIDTIQAGGTNESYFKNN